MSFLGASKKSPGQRVRYYEWNALVEQCDLAYLYGGFFIKNDKIPIENGKYNIGSPERRIKNFYGLFGDFSEGLTVAGRPVIKDCDPISIAYIYQPAKKRITDAINESTIPSKIDVTITYLESLLSELESGVSLREVQTTAQDQLKTSTRDAIIEAIKKDLEDIKAKLQELRAEVDELYTKTFSKLLIDLPIDGKQILFYPTLGKSIKTRSWWLHTDSSKGRIFLWAPVSKQYIGALFATRSGVAQHNRVRVELYKDEPIECLWQDLDVGSSILIQITYKEE